MPIPVTKVRTSHAVTIRVSSTIIGYIQSWAPNQARPTTPVYQLDASTAGLILERAPMNITGTTINVTRVDLYNSRMEEAWGPGFNAIKMLTDQVNSLTIYEKWSNPDGSSHTQVYEGCWFTSLGRNLPADGDKIVRVNAAIDYVSVHEG